MNINSSPSTASAGGPSASSATPFDPWLLWVTFRRCWLWAVPCGAVLGLLAVFAVLSSFVPSYQASHLLEANKDYLVFEGVMPTVDNLAKTEKQLFFNPIVIDPVLADASELDAPSLRDADSAEERLRKNLSVTDGGTRSQLVVSYVDTDRDAAARVCNAVVDSYLRQRDAFDHKRVSNLEEWLKPEIRKWEDEVADRQRRVKAISEQVHGYAPGQAVAAMENQNDMALVSKLRSDISDLEVKLSLLTAQSEMDRDRRGDGDSGPTGGDRFVPPPIVVERRIVSPSEIEDLVENDSEVREVRGKIARYKDRVVDMEDSDLDRVRKTHYAEMKGKRDFWEGELDRVLEEATVRVTEDVERRIEDNYQREKKLAEQRIESLRREFEAGLASAKEANRRRIEQRAVQQQQERENLRAEMRVLRNQYEQELARLEQYGGDSAELQFAQEHLIVANDVLRKLRDRFAAIKTERRQDGAVRSLAKATPPKSPVETVPMKKMMAASGAAFFIPFLLGLLWELKVQRLTDSNAVERRGELAPVVGEIARLPSESNGGRGRRIFEESVDSLRANLFLSKDTKHIRSIAVVSSMSGEGKSSVASQLAISIAKATGETVLLIDSDLRCPDQHEIFGLELGDGLSGVLANKCSLSEAIDTSLGDLVHVLSAGRLTCSPHRLVSPSAMRDLVDQALDEYSYVVVDTAPVLSAGETLAVASSVDSTLLCVMRDVSRMESVTRTTRRLEAAGAHLSGTVFSGVSPRQYAYRYGDYHYANAVELNG